jgi:1,4-alpha-glucan branching enzyme/maltooligosyltrehalose trehalohydrolase
MLAFYRSLLALRHEHIVPLLSHGGLKGGTFEVKGRAVKVTWQMGETELEVLANLSNDIVAIGSSAGEQLYAFGDVEADRLGPWSVLWHRRHLT